MSAATDSHQLIPDKQALSPALLDDRVAGSVVASAVGDALGAPYETRSPIGPNKYLEPFTKRGRFGHQPGEWTDDTSMAIPILWAAARGESFESDETLGRIVAAWCEWALSNPSDIGIHTRWVLMGLTGVPNAELARAALSRAEEGERRPQSYVGNGSLMRTTPLALAYLGPDDEPTLAAAARKVGMLTHFHNDAADACVLWSVAIRRAILTGQVDIVSGLHYIPESRRDVWVARIAVAESSDTRLSQFTNNGQAVQAFQEAWCAVYRAQSRSTPAERLRGALEDIVRSGYDTDTVAAIAGGLLGAAEGLSAVPPEWVEKVRGWKELTASQLGKLAVYAGRASYFKTKL